MSELIKRDDLLFLLFECFQCDHVFSRPRYQEHNRETVIAALDTAEKIAQQHFANHTRLLDNNEPSFDGQRVSMPAAVQQGLKAFIDAGFMNALADFEQDGMQLPEAFAGACFAYFTAANPGTAGYPFLTMAALRLIENFATDELAKRFVPAMREGRYFGTMALTEPQAGSSLADITTRAEPQADGTYRIKGHKIYISGGDHELSENIVHLVLARIQGAPEGTKGISLFIVPKYRVNDAGEMSGDNDVILAGLFHKLGYRGTTSTALNFGENDNCQGFLVGEAHQGLRYMFQMMNEARLGVGFGAAAIAYRGYQLSLDYARERIQGRAVTAHGMTTAPVAIVEHADVKRLLLTQKVYAEGALALCLFGATLTEDAKSHPDPEGQKQAANLLDLLTPIIKSWPSRYGAKANDLAIQVLGGAGYTRDHLVEQCWRDNRLNAIHEGTEGIQALDLLGRKVWQHGGMPLLLLAGRIQQDMEASSEDDADAVKLMASLLDRIGQLSHQLGARMQNGEADKVLALAHHFMMALGHTVVGWLWLKQSNCAQLALADSSLSDGQTAFYRGKIQGARFFFRHELPQAHIHLQALADGDTTYVDTDPSWL